MPSFTVFDPEDDGANEQEYQVIFKEYKKLVDELMESHMKDLEITPEQFERACQDAEGVLSTKLHQTLFEQIWAANNFSSFKTMMTEINIDLHLWALEVLAARFGTVSDFLLLQQQDVEGDDYFLKEAKRRSLRETDIQKDMKKKDQRRLSKSQVLEVKASVNEEPRGATDIVSRDEEKVEAVPKPSKTRNRQEEEDDDDHPKIHVEEIPVPKEAKSQETRVISSPRHPGRRLPSMSKNMDPDEIKHRQEYLRRQRDKLLGLKKEEREKQLARIQELERSGKRPQTAKYMAMEEEAAEREDDGQKDGNERKSLAFMRSLAARIKAEVADDGEDEDKDEKQTKEEAGKH